jgi:virulence-associated protein VagC
VAVKKRESAGVAAKPKTVMETRVFKSGNSYAVRLPKLLYSGGEGPVYMQKLEDGKLLIVPKTKRRWPTGFFESFGNVPPDFEAPLRPAVSPDADARDAALFEDQ